MKSEIEVAAGHKYKNLDPRLDGRVLVVKSVKLQEKTEGRFKARYTYATCAVEGISPERIVKVDTDRLRSRAYALIYAPCPAPAAA